MPKIADLDRPRLRMIVAALLLMIGGVGVWEIVSVGLGQQLVQWKQQELAFRIRPRNSRASVLAASAEMRLGRVNQAQALAREAISAAPTHVPAIRTLAQAWSAQDPNRGAALMLLSAKLGWHDRPTQLWIINQAIRTGQYGVAMQRAEALVRMQRDREVVFKLLRLLAAKADARRILLRSLSAEPFWRRNFLSPDEKSPPAQLAILASILVELTNTSAPPKPVEARYAIDGLAEAGMLREAYALYNRLFLRGRGEALVWNGGFESTDIDYRAGSSATLFDWRVYDTGSSWAEIQRTPSGRVLSALAAGPAVDRILERTLILLPGTYSLSYRVRSDDANAPYFLRWTIRCIGSSRTVFQSATDPLTNADWEVRREQFAIPPTCGAQVLELQTSATVNGRGAESFFDDVMLRRL